MVRMVDSSGNVSFAAATSRVGDCSGVSMSMSESSGHRRDLTGAAVIQSSRVGVAEVHQHAGGLADDAAQGGPIGCPVTGKTL